MDKLQTDLGRLRKAFNERIQYVVASSQPYYLLIRFVCRYFRQLQELSDTVADAVWDGSVEAAIQENNAEAASLEVKIATGKTRQRYLDYLAKSQGEGGMEEEEACILCKCEFERGYITQWYVVVLDTRNVNVLTLFVALMYSARYILRSPITLSNSEIDWGLNIGMHESLAAS